MKYYVVSDVHGYYTQMIDSLTKAGFFSETEPHKLIVCGDLMDRGREAEKMQEFMMDLMEKDQLIFIRGNHEDLMLCMLDDIVDDLTPFLDYRSYHIRNGTLDTAHQLNHFTLSDFLTHPMDFVFKARQSDFVKNLIPASVNYFETENYIFVHGFIPCVRIENSPPRKARYSYIPIMDWRNASAEQWNAARWTNGMEAAEIGKITIPNKTIVCGHWHASYGHSVIKHRCSEHGPDAIFEPYYGDGIIGIDACTAYSGIVNCIVIEDKPVKEV